MKFLPSTTTLFTAAILIGLPTAWVRAAAVTGWVKDTSFGGAGTVTSANTNSPILGNGSANNADNVAIYAPFPTISLAVGSRLTLTGSAEFIGSSSVGDFRWGLFQDDGVAPAYAGWLGYFGSAETIVWSKNPAGTSFATTTFASIASNRGTVLGQMSEPTGVPFDPGIYHFSMKVERYGDNVDVSVAISNNTTGFSIVTPSYQENDPSRLTFSFDRVGFLSGSALDADQVRLSGIDVSASLIEAPILQVRSDGMMRIVNNVSPAFDLIGYEITSVSGSLNQAQWTGIGGDWAKAGGSTGNVLAEVSAESTASIGFGQSIYLGHAYSPGATHDLQFRFVNGAREELRGLVQYVSFPDPAPGDFEADGDVDGADFATWQSHFATHSGATVADGDADGDRDVDGADFVVWQTHFPTAAAAGSVPVPEPTAWFLQWSAILWLLLCRVFLSCRWARSATAFATDRM